GVLYIKSVEPSATSSRSSTAATPHSYCPLIRDAAERHPWLQRSARLTRTFVERLKVDQPDPSGDCRRDFLPQRACAAFLALALRCSAVSRLALASPPRRPSDRSRSRRPCDRAPSAGRLRPAIPP